MRRDRFRGQGQLGRLPRRVACALTVGALLAACSATPRPPIPADTRSATSVSASPVGSSAPATSGAPAAVPTPSAPAIASSAPSGLPSGRATPRYPTAPARLPTPLAAFGYSVAPVTSAQLGASWHPGCPVGPAQLRQIRLVYWGFDNQPHTGTLVVHASVVAATVQVFATLYRARFPIRSIRPASDFGGDDDASMAADNTSGFNCRYVSGPGPRRWSVHAYGQAIDVNPVENPYLDGVSVRPAAGAAYLDRSRYRPGMALRGGVLVAAFAAVGWAWGGNWSPPDYQHFSATGG